MAITRWGEQPARMALRRERYSIPLAARIIGVPETHLRNTVLGCTRPSPVVRRELPKLLGVPLTDLFTDEVLEKEYNQSLNPWLPLAGAS